MAEAGNDQSISTQTQLRDVYLYGVRLIMFDCLPAAQGPDEGVLRSGRCLAPTASSSASSSAPSSSSRDFFHHRLIMLRLYGPLAISLRVLRPSPPLLLLLLRLLSIRMCFPLPVLSQLEPIREENHIDEVNRQVTQCAVRHTTNKTRRVALEHMLS